MSELYDTINPHGWTRPIDPPHTKSGPELVQHTLMYGLTGSDVKRLKPRQKQTLRWAGII